MSFTTSQLDAAYAVCLKAARDHYENFPVASMLLPRATRRHVAAIYAFAREADDYADEPAFEGRRMELLAGWRHELHRAARGQADRPIFVALSDTIASHALPVELLDDLIKAFERDVRDASYETFEELLGYCTLSANPVGRLVLHLFGRAQEDLARRSDAICTALQLANFWQDAPLDLARGRCYLPRQVLERHGASVSRLRAGKPSPELAGAVEELVGRTRELFARGEDLPRLVGGRLGFQLRLVALGGRRILEKIEAGGYDLFGRRPKLTGADWGRLVLKAARAAPR